MSDDALPMGADVRGIGPRLLRLRTVEGATQAHLAGDSFTRAYVSSIEAGKRTPSPRAVAHFADRLGVRTEDLCFDYEPGIRGQLRQALADARIALSGGETDRAREAYQQAMAEADRRQDPEVGAQARCGLGMIARHEGDPDQAVALFTRAEKLLCGAPLRSRLQAVVGTMGGLFARGAIDQALTLAEEHLREAELTGQIEAEFSLRAATVLPHVERGDLNRAAAAADAALRIAARVRDSEILAQGYYHINRVLVVQSRYTEAERVLARALTLNEHLGLRTEVGMCHFARGYLSACRGDLGAAEASLREATAHFTATRALPRLVNANAELSEVLRRLGRTDEAMDLVRKCRTLARRSHDPEQAAELDRIEAQTAADIGEEADSEQLFRSALERYAGVGAAYETGLTCRLFGDRLMAWGRTAEAAEIYRRGLTAWERG
ncbi:helix-turn-helix domain-containing protein [Streptomyces luteolus]|uniref:Helix-turn-helix transcriptional regulator n=1 Tax=Streptomyces luteolus TaxID=3043615 RepID=A0ABT6SPN6_9ACTN|nr:helix-turn-helix transcriptional regulator [Streptomyces sp. B-S-A12]MDI3417577.1 helix-turn-helix transcriptional regulator [Streptomyces sp. B-S-A12]